MPRCCQRVSGVCRTHAGAEALDNAARTLLNPCSHSRRAPCRDDLSWTCINCASAAAADSPHGGRRSPSGFHEARWAGCSLVVACAEPRAHPFDARPRKSCSARTCSAWSSLSPCFFLAGFPCSSAPFSRISRREPTENFRYEFPKTGATRKQYSTRTGRDRERFGSVTIHGRRCETVRGAADDRTG